MELEFIQSWGLAGLFISCFLAATVIPFSAEILVITALLAGCNPIATYIVATIGNTLGSLTSYGMGYLGKWEWIERWLHVSREKLEKQKAKIDKYGVWLALLCWLPFIGDVFAIGLGFYRLDFVKCLIFIFLGKAIRFAGCLALYSIFGEKFIEFLTR
ncbi:MAG: DedA family protein [Marinifilaceae bacterium]|nr:DedA family protein [Marinifilaceae bacterium]